VTLCLVTDRRRFDPPMQGVLAHIRRAVAARIDLIQIRERDLEASDLAALVASAMEIARGTPTRILVNDRLDVALACGADGVQLRADSFDVAEARRVTPSGFLIGRSVHSVEEAQAATDADYLVAGTLFPTASKLDSTTLLGCDGLRAIVQSVRVPVLAIGGVTVDRADRIAAAGAAGVAGIALFDTPMLTDVVGALRHRFDSVRPAP
jgi:thiamine-phosphate pyrophosphorylase